MSGGAETELNDPAADRRRRLRHLAPAALIFVAAMTVLMATDNLYGFTYDEPIYTAKSGAVVEWLSLLSLRPADALSPRALAIYWHGKDQHPGCYKLLTALCASTIGRLGSPASQFRAGTNLLCALCLAAVYLFIAGLWGRAAGAYGVGALLCMPRVFAHCHLTALDAPIMATSFITVIAVWQACVVKDDGSARASRRAWLWAVAAGALWGMALGTKLNSVVIPLIVLPWVFVFARRRLWRLLVSFAVVGPLVFFITWPWLWDDTWSRLGAYIMFHWQHWQISVMYFGRVYTVAPWHYPLVMTAITLPPVTLVLALVGGMRVAQVWRVQRSPGQADARAAAMALVLLGLVMNLVPNCLPSTPKYGGVRLFLPIFPYIAVLAAVGLRAVLDWVVVDKLRGHGDKGRLGKQVTALVVALALAGPIKALGRFVPYHLSYYNCFIGGLPGATRAGMEPTYWGESYRYAASWLIPNARPGSTVWVEPQGYESTFRLFELGQRRPDLLFSTGLEGFETADYAVTQNKATEFTIITHRLVAERRPVYSDGIDGVPIIYVFDLKQGP